MATRKAASMRLYWNGASTEWARTLRSFADEAMTALCIRQWQRASITVAIVADESVTKRGHTASPDRQGHTDCAYKANLESGK